VEAVSDMGAMEICELICWEYSPHKGTVSEDNLDIALRTGVMGIGRRRFMYAYFMKGWWIGCID
jgi:hypothetical protein